ncbi:hypothetical protein ACP70R_004470 [Stipagrostis hirtigluma subsp. patula]
MRNSLLHHLVLLLLLAISPLAAARVHCVCVGDGTYAANSTYEANLRRLAAVLTEAALPGSYTSREVGHWPNRLQAAAFCRHHRRGDGFVTCAAGNCSGGDDYSCAACIAGAFREVESACPYHREAFFSNLNCTLLLEEFRIFRGNGVYEGSILKGALASGLIFQAIGFACLLFLLLCECRGQKRGTAM